jgi:hypothetical protein
MVEFLCPNCGRKSYTAAEEFFSPCQYCGCILSPKYGADRRQEVRAEKECAAILAYREHHFEAKAMDFSQEGLCVKIFGEFPGTAGDIIDLIMANLQVKARVMWVNKMPIMSLMGLQRLS